MLAYGCPHVLFKVDRAGEGQEICAGDLPLSRSPSFAGFTHDMFLEVRGAAAAAGMHVVQAAARSALPQHSGTRQDPLRCP